MRYAQALADWGDVGGYEAETLWDVCTVAALGTPYDRASGARCGRCRAASRSGLVLECLLRGPDEVLMLDEPDNYLDVPTKRWLEEQLLESPKTVLFVSHDRELLARTASRIVTLEPGPAGSRPGPTAEVSRRTTRLGRTGSSGSRSCAGAGTRSGPSSRRWS